MAILGLDIGTTGCKATVFSSGGEILSYAYEEYPIESPRAGWFELDPERVWRAAARVMQRANRDSTEAVQSICTSSLGEAFVCLSEHGDVLCGSMLYLDERGQQESEWIVETLGDARILKSTGHSPNSMYSLPKLLWLKKHRPEVYQQTRWLHFFGDYILYRLTGEHVTEYSLAARSLCFDVREKCWDLGILHPQKALLTQHGARGVRISGAVCRA